MADDDMCCGCAALDSDVDYNMGLHVGAIFILFGISAAGALLPFVSKHVPLLSANGIIIEWLMAFGFGVVIATGFIHMMNDGIEKLSNQCLGEVVENYESLGMTVVLATIVVMHLIECESAVFFASKGGSHGHSHGHNAITQSAAASSSGTGDDSVAVSVNVAVAPTPNDEVNSYKKLTDATHNEKTLNKKLAMMLFELGVIFHSVIIGIDLGITVGTEFKTLLAAICFHQFFEGIAIGGSALSSIESTKNVMLMNMVYAVTTPIGLAIGIGIRSTYSETSVTSLWVQGTLNCIAAGILLYTGLVELLTYQMTTNGQFLTRVGNQRFALYLALWLGAGLMALIGKWA